MIGLFKRFKTGMFIKELPVGATLTSLKIYFPDTI